MNTLILVKTRHGMSLQDAKGVHIGWFNSESDARQWCAYNGYKLRVQ